MMQLDNDKIDRTVLALLYLGIHNGARAWKAFDWDAMNRLHEKGFMTDPRGKAKSVVFTEEGLREARKLLEELFSSDEQAAPSSIQNHAAAAGKPTTVGQTDRARVMNTKDLAFQFRITLRGIEPAVWRRIAVPAKYSFWDLHVAIQDAMGWLDYHLHAFRIQDPKTGAVAQIGIPDDSFEDVDPFLAGWKVPIVEYFREPGTSAEYEYDFGDGWEHEIVLEQVTDRIPRKRYPKCLDGARACPPEDCGGVPGYQELLEVLGDRTHEEYASMVEWLGRKYDPAAFSAEKVRFENPKKRWRIAFERDSV